MQMELTKCEVIRKSKKDIFLYKAKTYESPKLCTLGFEFYSSIHISDNQCCGAGAGAARSRIIWSEPEP
jgi:hypothetical protein